VTRRGLMGRLLAVPLACVGARAARCAACDDPRYADLPVCVGGYHFQAAVKIRYRKPRVLIVG
jgi:hypothetical protein